MADPVVGEADDVLPDPPKNKRLRSGWTTGTCASAAAKAAAIVLATGLFPTEVEVGLPSGARVSFPVNVDVDGCPYVIKDAGDDPDCTNGAHITAQAERVGHAPNEVLIDGGTGVGRVTLPGLGLEIGTAAINPVPRRMIELAVREVVGGGVRITISVPGGQQMAEKTTNSRLGIVGGISILGTTGIVRPFSTSSFRSSVVQQIEVAAAQGHSRLIFATGSRSESIARSIFPDSPEVCFVEVGDFTGIALKRASRGGFSSVIWVGMVGKIAKLAQGTLMTHFHRSHLDTKVLQLAAEHTSSSPAIAHAATSTTTARHFYEVCMAEGNTDPLQYLTVRARETIQGALGSSVRASVYMVDFDATKVICRSTGAGKPDE